MLQAAAGRGRSDLVQKLLSGGANVHAATTWVTSMPFQDALTACAMPYH